MVVAVNEDSRAHKMKIQRGIIGHVTVAATSSWKSQVSKQGWGQGVLTFGCRKCAYSTTAYRSLEDAKKVSHW